MEDKKAKQNKTTERDKLKLKIIEALEAIKVYEPVPGQPNPNIVRSRVLIDLDQAISIIKGMK